MSQADLDAFAARLEDNMRKLRGTMDPRAFAAIERKFREGIRKISVQIKRKRRPDDGGMPALVEPPRGPMPLQGGAEAPLEFDS